MTKQECVQQLSAPCFWDTDRETFDMDQYPAFIVSRVFEIGTLNDWRTLVSYYGLDRIVEVCKQMRHIDKVSLAFITTISKPIQLTTDASLRNNRTRDTRVAERSDE